MGKSSTVRQILTTVVSNALKNDGLLPNELKSIVDHVISTSSISYDEETMDLKIDSCNSLGLGDIVDKEIIVPRFIAFEFNVSPIQDFVTWQNDSKWRRTWKLQSFRNFDQLEQYIAYLTWSKQVTVLIDGNIEGFDMLPISKAEDEDEYDICGFVWKTKIYQVAYTDKAGCFHGENFGNRYQAQTKVQQLVKQGIEEICVKNLITDAYMPFTINKVLFSSDKTKDTEPYLVWYPVSLLDESEDED